MLGKAAGGLDFIALFFFSFFACIVVDVVGDVARKPNIRLSQPIIIQTNKTKVYPKANTHFESQTY